MAVIPHSGGWPFGALAVWIWLLQGLPIDFSNMNTKIRQNAKNSPQGASACEKSMPCGEFWFLQAKRP